MKIILPILILATGLVTYWLVGAYFMWDIGWLATMAEITAEQRVGRLFHYLTLQLGLIFPFAPTIVNTYFNK